MAYRRTTRSRATTGYRRVSNRPQYMVFRGVEKASGNVAPGTTVLTDLVGTAETTLGVDLAGAWLVGIRGRGACTGTVGGAQTYGIALLKGANSLDPADVLPASAPQELNYFRHRMIPRAGTSHYTGAAVPSVEFDTWYTSLSFRSRRGLRIPTKGETVFFCEETLTQTIHTHWWFDLVFRTG